MISLVPIAALFAAGVAAYEYPPCYLPLDIMFLQDTTRSFEDHLPQIPHQLSDLVDLIVDYHPYSRFGIAEFKDKPYKPFGQAGDYCYKLVAPLGTSKKGIIDAYSDLKASGGLDGPDSQFHAITGAWWDSNNAWTETDPAARVLILNTDSIPHFMGDESSRATDYPWIFNDGHMLNGPDIDCIFKTYPSAHDIQFIFRYWMTYLILLTPDRDHEVVDTWKWIYQELIHQNLNYYQIIADGNDVGRGILDALDYVSVDACGNYGATRSSNVTKMSH